MRRNSENLREYIAACARTGRRGQAETDRDDRIMLALTPSELDLIYEALLFRATQK